MEIRKNTRSFSFLAFITAGILLSGCSISTATDYEKELLTFKKNRVTSLKSRSGYLNLVGLHWIAEGKSQFGSDPGNEFVFPKEFPANFGSVTKKGDRFIFNFRETVLLDSAEKISNFSFSTEALDHTFSWHSYQWFVIKRGENYAIRLKDFENPDMDPKFEIPYYPIDVSWKIKGSFEAYPPGKNRTISNIFGHPIEQPAIGIVSFLVGGKSFSLEAHMEGPKRTIIFMDGTTGNETYSGGRELYFDAPDGDGNVIVDFNKAFNFPCAFNLFTTCPVPPPINRLKINITAGEKVFK